MYLFERATALPLSRECNLDRICCVRSILISVSGIYVPNDERWPEKFRGIGIRIEDSVCVGDEHPIVLSPEAVKEVSLEVEWKPHFCALANVTTRSKTLKHCESET